MTNTSKIYWSYCHNIFQVRANQPVSVITNYFKGKDIQEHGLEYVKCPAFKDYFNNTFGLQSLFSYDLTFGDSVSSQQHDQNFFEEMVNVRNEKSRLASFRLEYIFIAKDDNLEMEVLPSMLEANSFNSTAILIPAVMDIGQYLRPIDCSFHCRKNTMDIKEQDIYSYVKFNTNKKIEFERFLWDDTIKQEISNTIVGLKGYRNLNIKPLTWYYKKQQRLKTKERVIKLIKNNLL